MLLCISKRCGLDAEYICSVQPAASRFYSIVDGISRNLKPTKCAPTPAETDMRRVFPDRTSSAVTLRSEGAVTCLVCALCLNVRAEDAEDGAVPERSQVNIERAGSLSDGEHSSPNPPKDAPVITYSRFSADDDPYTKYSDVASWANRCKDSGVSMPRSLGYSDIDCSASDFGSEHSNSSEEPWEGSVSYINSETETVEARSEVDGRTKWLPSRPVSRSGSTASSKRRLTAFTPKKEGLTMGGEAPSSSPIYRLVLAGDAGSGKSSFLLRLCLNEFKGDITTTLGVDFQMKKLLVDGDYTTLQIWDTAGQERFRSIAKSYFRKAHGVLLMYDVTSQASFLNVRQWIDEIKNSCDRSIPVMLIGNKTDLRTEGTQSGIPTSMGEKLAMAYSSLFCETSAKDGTNVVEAVLHLARQVKKTVDVSNENAETVTKLSIPEKTSSCCKI
ncbi:unnamed protein product [Ranitomeya imitator]|uniref:Ras and EF-hand domain-containing protein n=1 Tax=Ranitomeya imitator TaxID=111125 RepID=A0ABN9MNN1_9NEOB|nr:unnamed protein product [Ranitomeya imitator]